MLVGICSPGGQKNQCKAETSILRYLRLYRGIQRGKTGDGGSLRFGPLSVPRSIILRFLGEQDLKMYFQVPDLKNIFFLHPCTPMAAERSPADSSGGGVSAGKNLPRAPEVDF